MHADALACQLSINKEETAWLEACHTDALSIVAVPWIETYHRSYGEPFPAVVHGLFAQLRQSAWFSQRTVQCIIIVRPTALLLNTRPGRCAVRKEMMMKINRIAAAVHCSVHLITWGGSTFGQGARAPLPRFACCLPDSKASWPLWRDFSGPKMLQNPKFLGLRLGKLTPLPRYPSWWEGGSLPPPRTPPRSLPFGPRFYRSQGLTH